MTLTWRLVLSRFIISDRINSTMLKRKLAKAAESSPDFPLKKQQTILTAPLIKYENPTFHQQFLNIQLDLNSALRELTFTKPVAYIYNPVEYAFKPNEMYVEKYCTAPKKMLFVGMNPGPFGMCQTGVPFGAIPCVRDWLGVEADVGKPDRECPERPVTGFACKRVEVSGDRLWNFLKDTFEKPERFFQNAFVYNYCPLALMRDNGGNVTPADLKDSARQLEDICDKYFHEIIRLLGPEIIVGIGVYAEKRILQILRENNVDGVRVLRMAHPSPRAPGNWFEKTKDFFTNHNLMELFP